MRILVVSQYFWPENFRINDLVAELCARGHEVTVLTGVPNYPEGDRFPDFAAAPERFSRFAGARIVRVPMLTRGQGRLRLVLNYLSFAAAGALWGPWRLRGLRFDSIFVFQTSPITAALPALLMRRWKQAPVLMWILDLWPETLSAIGVVRSPRALALVGALVRFIYRRCDRVLVQSRAFAANVRRYADQPDKLRYFPGWAEDVFARGGTPATPAPELAPYEDCFKVLFAGNIGEAQDFPTVLQAAQRLKARDDIRWIVVGDGRAAAGLRADIQRLGLQERVILLGRHPLERMPSFFSGADALLVSLRRDPIFAMTIPGKVQSYLAAGVPLVGMLDGEGADVIRESGGGLVGPSGDAEALAANVEALAAMTQDQRRALGERGRRYGAAEFDRDTLVSSLEGWMAEARAASAR